MQNPHIACSRRRFLHTSAAAGAFSLLPSGVLGAPGRPGANDRLNIASIGAGGRAADDLDGVKSENIVALCDVDWGGAAESFERFPKAKRYRDFRMMLDAEPGIDAVLVAIPDHCHAVAAMAAIKRGKHVYCEKPLTHTVYEARALTLAAREAKVATQMGNQGSAENGLRRAVEVIHAGVIGAPKELHVWSNRPVWPQGLDRPAGSDPIPDTLNWDAWLGPAAERPFKNGTYHTFN
ncbi:MAG: Gfo/Idh/MocA family oxidoreductase, partial [Verrucomicrobiae bacterium]|nr:Gfo/Idh/MocA family oxidoreductase [Verrucomicrobiae bacterium]